MELFIGIIVGLPGLYLSYLGIISFRESNNWLSFTKSIIVLLLGFLLIVSSLVNLLDWFDY